MVSKLLVEIVGTILNKNYHPTTHSKGTHPASLEYSPSNILTFLEPKKRGRGYVAAWRLLHEEIGKYKYSDNPENGIEQLFITIRQCEEIIARLDS